MRRKNLLGDIFENGETGCLAEFSSFLDDLGRPVCGLLIFFFTKLPNQSLLTSVPMFDELSLMPIIIIISVILA